MNRRTTFLVIGSISLMFSILPWLGLGGYAFPFPRLELVTTDSFLMGEVIYIVMELPVHLLGAIPVFDRFIFFQGEGVVTVRPFAISVFWGAVGIMMILITVREFRKCRISDFNARPHRP